MSQLKLNTPRRRGLHKLKRLTIDRVVDWHINAQIKFLKVEEAICYILAKTLDSEGEGTYGTGLIESTPEGYALSDTVLYRALAFLLEQELLTVATVAMPNRGRPRNIYKINQAEIAQCRKLAKLSTVFHID